MADISETHVIMGFIVAGFTGILGWFAKQVVEMRDGLRSIKQKLYGDDNQSEPDGLITEVHSIRGTVEDIDRRLIDVEVRTQLVEQTLAINHN